MIIRARSVVTMDGATLENGAVWIAGDTIAAVGSWAEVKAQGDGDVIDLGDCALLPGLINAHCHLDYTCLRDAIPPQESFTDWIRAINAAKASLTPADYRRSIGDGFAEAAAFGTTTVANLEAFPHLAASFHPPPLRTWWFAEMIDVRETVRPADVHASISAALGDPLAGIGLAPHAPFTASCSLYAEAANVSREHDLPLTTHLAESREEIQMFRDRCGLLFDFMKSIRRPMDDCGDVTPLQLLSRASLLDERWIVAHLNELTPDDFRLLEGAPRFHIAHCPRSHAYFGHSPFAAQKLRALGFNICIGTDSLASNDDLSLLAELRQFRKNEPSFTPRELLEIITVNAARALRQSRSLGRIKVGHAADLVAVPTPSLGTDPLEQCIDFAGEVPWSMVNGRELSK
jgi:cytosine/adenosine deaminase-related metal-dependent hydrolase